jgi:NAD(P)-dependent dehydrogenase (short-subunit alcohol dehydrogenase family)
MDERNEVRVALVTGAAHGIGEAIARRFAADGLRVIVTDIDDEAGRAVAASLGGAAEYRHLDVRSEEDWDRVSDDVLEAHGRLDVVVNNAGITGFEEGPVPHDPEHAALADWRRVHETNLDGTFLGCRAAIRAMRHTGRGAIVNVSSRSGLSGVPGAAAYASSKAAIRNHTKSVALYCAEQGLHIRCNAVFPGAILTRMWEPMLGDGPERDERMRGLVADVPVQRMGSPEEVAAAVAYLASDEAGYTTGSEVVIDGGLTAGTVARPDR